MIAIPLVNAGIYAILLEQGVSLLDVELARLAGQREQF